MKKKATARGKRASIYLAIGLTLAILFDTVQQVIWKVGVVAIPQTDSVWRMAEAALHEPLLALVGVLMVLRLVNWLWVLELADLSYAQPITALSYVTVTLFSALYLKEKLTLLQLAGMVLVMVGVWCISQTERDSRESEAAS
jgi:drug/metabolite transporter (DMT)-like permease